MRLLPSHYRIVRFLMNFKGSSCADAAEASGCAVGSIKGRVKGAGRLLMEVLDDYA